MLDSPQVRWDLISITINFVLSYLQLNAYDLRKLKFLEESANYTYRFLSYTSMEILKDLKAKQFPGFNHSGDGSTRIVHPLSNNDRRRGLARKNSKKNGYSADGISRWQVSKHYRVNRLYEKTKNRLSLSSRPNGDYI